MSKRNSLLESHNSLLTRRDILKIFSVIGIANLLTSCNNYLNKISTNTPQIKNITPLISQTKPGQIIPPSITPTPTQTIVLPNKTITQKINDRPFPSIFMAWSVADNLSMSFDQSAAYYDFIITNEWQFELAWGSNYPGLGNTITMESLQTGLKIYNKILENNPNIIIVAEIRYRDAYTGWLPDNSPYWDYDSNGKRIPGWGNYYMLDWHSPAARKRVATQSKAFIDTGIYDGVMLDWWDDTDPDRISMLSDIRKAIGNDKLIIVNSNRDKANNAAPFINGLFMEAAFSPYGAPSSPSDWRTISNTLSWAEDNLLSPHVNALETWSVKSPQDELNRMRATTTLALTHSNGYALFSSENHGHRWHSFWDHKELGKPIEKMIKRSDGAVQREFSGGTVIYNPMGNVKVNIEFSDARFSAANEQIGDKFIIEPMDGDLFLKK
jgi:hypothetical protein